MELASKVILVLPKFRSDSIHPLRGDVDSQGSRENSDDIPRVSLRRCVVVSAESLNFRSGVLGDDLPIGVGEREFAENLVESVGLRDPLEIDALVG